MPPDAPLTMAPHAHVTLLGVPVQAGTSQAGCLMGPASLRTAGLAAELQHLGCAVEDGGDLGPDLTAEYPEDHAPHMRNLAEIIGWTRAVSARVAQVLARGRIPLVLGGDHSLSMGSVDGVARHCRAIGKELFVLWLDAHADFNTPETRPRETCTACRSRRSAASRASRCSSPKGGRSCRRPTCICSASARWIAASGPCSTREASTSSTCAPSTNWASPCRFAAFSIGFGPRSGVLHVSLDVDFLDPSLAPGVGTTVPGGATYREAHLIMEMIHDSGLLGSLDVVELNPFLDDRGKSALILVDLVASLFGRQVMDRPTAARPMF